MGNASAGSAESLLDWASKTAVRKAVTASARVSRAAWTSRDNSGVVVSATVIRPATAGRTSPGHWTAAAAAGRVAASASPATRVIGAVSNAASSGCGSVLTSWTSGRSSNASRSGSGAKTGVVDRSRSATTATSSARTGASGSVSSRCSAGVTVLPAAGPSAATGGRSHGRLLNRGSGVV
jgi:hypothetical protein